jgi:hypothetical protein
MVQVSRRRGNRPQSCRPAWAVSSQATRAGFAVISRYDSYGRPPGGDRASGSHLPPIAVGLASPPVRLPRLWRRGRVSARDVALVGYVTDARLGTGVRRRRQLEDSGRLPGALDGAGEGRDEICVGAPARPLRQAARGVLMGGEPEALRRYCPC